MAYVNARIRESAADFTLEPGESWGFFCECDDPTCREIVYLTLPDYERLRDGTKSVLAHGHRDTRRRAKRLHVEASALRGQAVQAAARATSAIARAQRLTGRSVHVCVSCGYGALADVP